MKWFYILIVAIVVIVVITLLYNNKKKDKIAAYNIKSQDYYLALKQQLDKIEQQTLQSQVDQVNHIKKLVIAKNRELSHVTRQAENEIRAKIKNAELQIEKRWNSSEKNYYYCLALHYQSFTLADTVKLDSNMLQDVRKPITKEINRLNDAIKPIQDRINSGKANGPDYSKIKQLHILRRDLINKRNYLNSIIDEKEELVIYQNSLTKRKKEYIRTHFGKRGRLWAEKIDSKHKN